MDTVEMDDTPALPVLTAIPAEEKRGPGRPPKNKETLQEDRSQSAVTFSQNDDRTVGEWLGEISSGGQIKIKLLRLTPKAWNGHNVAGMLDEFDEPFSEREVQNRFGGGKFTARCWRLSSKSGGWVMVGARTFEVAGDPKITGEITQEDNTKVLPLNDIGTPVNRVMNAFEKLTDDAQKRAERAESELRSGASQRNNGMDPAVLNLLTSQLTELQRQLAAKDDRMMEAVTRKPENTFQDRILEKMVDGESARIDALRANHESELRQLRQSHHDELKSTREHLSEEIRLKERSQEREIGMLRESYMAQIESLKQGYEARLDGFKSRHSDLERQLTDTKHELTELKLKKDKGPLDSMTEIVQLKNAMESLGLGKDEEPAPWWQSIIGVAEPLVKATANRVENAPPAPPPQAAPQRRRPITPEQRAAAQAAAAGKSGPPVPVKKAEPTISPADLQAAVAFVEGAIRTQTEPATLAQSISAMLPGSTIELIHRKGVDGFLENATLDIGSPLSTQAGRNYLRAVLRCLSGEAPE